MQGRPKKNADQTSDGKIVLCICGMAGSGKSTVSKRLAEKYGLRYYSGGDALKALASEMGYDADKRGWWESPEGIRFLRKRMENLEFDREVDIKLLKWAEEGNVVLDSRTMPWLLEGGFKIWLGASEEVRVRRIAKRDSLTFDEALKCLREKENKTRDIYKRLYRFDLGEDFTPFHLILDVNLLSKDETFYALCMVIRNLLLKKARD